MAIGNTKRDSTELVIIRDEQSEDKRKSHFNVLKKVGEEWVVTQKSDRFSGHFKGLKRGLKYDPSIPRHKELIDKYGNRPIISLSLIDPETNETYSYKFSLRLSTRTLLNRLFNLKTGENLEVSIWNDKEKGYENFSLRQNNERVEWKYGMDEIPRAEEIRKKDGTLVSRDFEVVDKFFLDKVDSFSLKGHVTDEVPATVATSTALPAKSETVEEDSIPF